jgi:hypothetical protein
MFSIGTSYLSRSNLYEFTWVALGFVLEKSGLLGLIFWHWVPLKNMGGSGAVAQEAVGLEVWVSPKMA